MSETTAKGNGGGHPMRLTPAEEKMILRLRHLSGQSDEFQVFIITLHPLALRVYSQVERLEPKEVEHV